MNALKGKLSMIENQILMQDAKTVVLIKTLLRLKPSLKMDDYIMIIRKKLS